jgi:hypothetical protein
LNDKVRCDALWETISEHRSPILPPLLVEDIRDKSKSPVRPPLVPDSNPAEIPQDASSMMPSTLKGKGSGKLGKPDLVRAQSKTEEDIRKERVWEEMIQEERIQEERIQEERIQEERMKKIQEERIQKKRMKKKTIQERMKEMVQEELM